MKLATTLLSVLMFSMLAMEPAQAANPGGGGGGFPLVGKVKATGDRDGNGVDDLWVIDVYGTGFLITLVDRPGAECKPPRKIRRGDKVAFRAWPLKTKSVRLWRLLSWIGKLP